MKEKKIPLRRCVVTGERLEKKLLIRVVRTPEGNVIVDETGRANGRGAYLKKDKDVILKAKKTKILEKHLEVSVEDSVYETLINLINNDKQ
ncbi:MAG: YlxR family protein [Clostridia bacterium]|nr:YlxR family protein [Clostridia bacterium]